MNPFTGSAPGRPAQPGLYGQWLLLAIVILFCVFPFYWMVTTSLKTQIIFLKDCPAQTPVGYNRTHVTPQRTRVATLPVGYNDGYPFRLGGRGQGGAGVTGAGAGDSTHRAA